MKGRFIVFEGPDGSGKSTACNNCYEYLKSKGVDVIKIREPGTTSAGEKIRDIVVNEQLDPISEILLFAASRRELIVNTINKALEEGTTVLCDRYVYSTFVYQGYVQNCNKQFIDTVHTFCPVPDVTVILNIDYREAIQRVFLRAGEQNKFDMKPESFYKKVSEGYDTIDKLKSRFIKNTTLFRVNTTDKTRDKTFELIRSVILDAMWR